MAMQIRIMCITAPKFSQRPFRPREYSAFGVPFQPPSGNHTMANVTDRDCRKAANRASTVELPSGPKIFPATATAKITARSRRLRPLGAEASDLHAEDVGHRHRGGRRGVTLRLSFRLIHSCSQRFTGGRRPCVHAARDARRRRRTVMRSPRKRVKAQVFRGFKSHLHRH